MKICLAVVLIGLGIWYYQSNRPEDLIDLDAPIVKSEDSVSTVEIANREMVQVRFSWEASGIKYNDALNIVKSEYDKLSPADIEKMKQERFLNWARTVNEQSKK